MTRAEKLHEMVENGQVVFEIMKEDCPGYHCIGPECKDEECKKYDDCFLCWMAEYEEKNG